MYPINRSLFESCPVKDGLPKHGKNAMVATCHRMIELFQIMDDVQLLWHERWDPERDWPGLFDRTHRFMVDVFPVIVGGSKSFRLGSKLYSGKYKRSVLKVHLMIA
jgi:hypothetical protein